MAAANNEFFEALSMLEHERGITAEYLIEKIKAAIIIAVKKNYEVEEDHIRVDIDPDTGRFDVALIQDIVADEDWYDEHAEIGVTEARKIRSSYEVGDRIITPLKTRDFGRIAAQTAKHVIRQGIREAERNQQLSEIQSRAHDIVQATVTRVDTEKGIVALDLGKGGEAVLPRNEQVPGEVYTEGETLQVYIVDVVSTERGPRVMISRTHPGLVCRTAFRPHEMFFIIIFIRSKIQYECISVIPDASDRIWRPLRNVVVNSECIFSGFVRFPIETILETDAVQFRTRISSGDVQECR